MPVLILLMSGRTLADPSLISRKLQLSLINLF